MNRHNVAAGIVLGLAGFAVNWFNLELFFNVDFLFGSIVTMFAMLRYGLTAGTIAALLAATCTWHHWHQPWAIIIFTVEAYFAGLLVKRRRWELLSGDILYWFTAGLLLVLFSYNQFMGLPFQATLLIALKQGVNGVFNTLVAVGFSIICAGRDSRTRELPSLNQVLFVSLALFVLIPAMGFLYFDTQKTFNRELKNYRDITARACEVSEHSVSLWLTLNRDTVKTLAGLVGSRERISQPEMQRMVDMMRSENREFIRMGIFNEASITQAFSPQTDEYGASTIGVDLSDRDYSAMLRSPPHPFVYYVNMGKIGVPVPRFILLAPILKGDDYRGAAFGVVDFSVIKHLLQDIVDTRSMVITLVDPKGRVVVSTRDSLKPLDQFVLPPSGSLTLLDDGVSHWIPTQGPGGSAVTRWYASFYVKEMPLTVGNGWKVIVESSIRPYLVEISRQTSMSLGVIAFLMVAIITLSRLFAGRYSSILQQLEDATRQLPMRISSGEMISWPRPITRELAGLTDNFKLMSTTIQQHVAELEMLNESLEQRVADRTQELNDNSTLLNSIINGTSDIVYVKDLQGRYLLFNTAAEEIVGKSAAEVLGKDDRYLFPLSEALTVMSGDRNVVEGGEVRTYEELLTDATGQMVTFLSTKGPLFDSAGNPVGIFGIARNISERKRSEVELQEANLFSKQVICSAQEGVVVYGLDLRYRIWNPFMEHITGISAEVVLGRHPSELFPFLLESGMIDHLEKVLMGEMLPGMDFQYTIPKTGKSGWVSDVSAPLRNTKGEIIGVIATVRENTLNKQLEDELRQALDAANTANSTMSRLLRTVAHEFRTPLGLLTGSTDILDRYWDRLTPEKRLEQNEHIRSAARQMSTMIDSVITFNQLGKVRPGARPVLLDIGEACRAICAEVETVWGAGHECNVAVDADCGTGLLDEILFRRILENLLTNAFRYTPPGGAVSLNVSRENHRLCLEITDTGIGIPEEDQKQIFEAFFRSRNVEGLRGLGLGLCIVNESLAQMGGTISVNSKTGEGTAMRVDIPVADPA